MSTSLDRDQQLRSALEQRVQRIFERGSGVPTFFERLLLDCARLRGSREQGEGAAEILDRWLERTDGARFCTYEERMARANRDGFFGIPPLVHAMSQGLEQPLQWKGLPLFKSIFDFALYPLLLQELRPRTILELGSGLGSSALWLRDQARLFGLDPVVLTIDLQPVAQRVEGVRYVTGDLAQIERWLPAQLLAELPHPWLVSEDAHVLLDETLLHLEAGLRDGDYLFIEDTCDAKRALLEKFLAQTRRAYRVDTRFTDYFGWNATTAWNSILRCCDEGRAGAPPLRG